MNTKFVHKFMNVVICLLFLMGTAFNGVTPVSAAPGVNAAATASNTAPTVGQTITVTVSIDMTESGGQSLGSYTGTLQWSPSVLTYVSHTDATSFGFVGAVNTDNVATGAITFNGANTSGATGVINALVVTFNVSGGGSAGLDLAFSAMSTSTFTDLLSVLSITETPVDVPAAVSLDGTSHIGTSNSGNSVTISSHTTGTGMNRLMLVGVSWNSSGSATTINSVEFKYGDPVTTLSLGSAVITQKVSGQNRYAAIYKLIDPPSGVTGSVVVTFSATFTTGSIAGVANFKGVDQTTPLGIAVGAGPSTTVSTISVDVATAGNELVFDTVFAGGQASPVWTMNSALDQSEQWNSSLIGNARGGGSIKVSTASPAVTTTMTWTRTTAGYMALVAVPINPAPVGPTQQLTMAVSGTGTVSPAVGAHTYPQNAIVPITATAGTGYTFSHWTPDDTPGDPIANPYQASTTVTMDADYTVTAHFAPETHNLTTSVVGSGSITKNPDIVGPYDYGTVVTLTAVPASGWLFDGWSGDLSGLTNPQTITMTAERSVTATFVEMLPGVVYPDGAISSNGVSSGTSISFAHTTGTGENRLTLVGVSWNAGSSTTTLINSVIFSYGTEPVIEIPFTEVITETVLTSGTPPAANPRYAAIYRSTTQPPENITGTLTINFASSVSNGIVAGGANFQGVDQTTPLGTPAGTHASASASSPTLELTGLFGDELVFDTVFLGASAETATLTAAGGQTQLWNRFAGNTRGTASTKQAAGTSVTMSWTPSTQNWWAQVAVPINPVPPSHTVTFEANGGTGIMSPQTASNTTTLTLNAFTRVGYSFSGWNTQADGLGSAYSDGASYDFLADLTLYAQWTALPNRTVTFNANGGTGTMSPQLANIPTTLSLNSFTYVGYSFSGWNTQADGLGTPYTDGEEYDFSADITLFAQWVPLGYHIVTFEANGGTGTMPQQSANIPTALATNTFTRAGYSFNNWNTLTNGLGTAYSNGATYDFLADMILYAQWTALPLRTVTFDSNGGTGTMSPQSANVPTALNANTFTRLGYYFTGWNTAANDSGTPYEDGAIYSFAADITLYAQWMALPTHTVTFNNNGGTGSMTSQFANIPTALSLNTFTRVGFSFSGWNTQADGLGTAYSDGAIYDFLADMTIYAQWTALPMRTVTFNSNGGTGTMTPQSANIPTALTLNAFTRAGYTFSNWNTAANGSGSTYTNGQTYSFAADLTLYAQWTALPMRTVTFNANGGTGTMAQQVANVPTALTLNSFTRSGFSFSGWNTQADGLGIAYTDGETYSFAADLTLFAQWVELPTNVVTVDGASSGTANSATNISFAHTTGMGINRLTLVGVSWNAGTSAKTITSVKFTYGNPAVELPFAEVITETVLTSGTPPTANPRYAAIYRSTVQPPQGTTGTITIAFSASVTNGIVAGGVNFQNVDQTTPLGTAVKDHATTQTGSSPSVNLIGLTGNELVFDTLFLGAGSSTYTVTTGTDQNSHWNLFVGNTRGAASSKQATGPSVTMSWTPSTVNWWAQVAVPIKPAVAGTTYDLTIAVSPTGGGTTTPTAGTYTHAEDAVVDITATPNPGYVFSSWSGDCSGTVPSSCQVTMNADKSVTANFTALTYTLTANVVGSGSITKNPNLSTYGYGAVVELTAVPASGWLFDGWSGDLSDMTNPQSVTMNANKTVTATFVQMDPEKVYVDGAVSSGTANNASSISFAHTTGTGENRLTLVGVSWNAGTSAKTISSVIFSYGDPATEIAYSEVITEPVEVTGTVTGIRYAAIYRSTAQPPLGTTGTITISFSASVTNGIVAGGVNFQNVNQSTPLGTPVSAHASVAASSPTLTLTDLAGNELVFDTVFLGAQNDTYNLSPDADQTQQWNGFDGNTRGVASTEQAASPVTMSWTPTTQNWWAQVAVPIRPVGGVVPSHTVTFDANGGTGTMEPQVANVPTALTPNAFTYLGYSFTGWNTAANGTGTAYADGDTYSFAADVTLYAQWTALPNHTVTFDANEGTGTMSPQIANVPTALNANTFTRLGYYFTGWNTAANDSGVPYADGAIYSFAADITLYAQWMALPTYTVTFNGNGGTGSMPSQWANIPTALTLNTFTRVGYSFTGWNTAANGSGTSYADGATYDFSADVTLYAQWTALPNHTVTFDANGGNGSMTPQVANVPTALTANAFTRTGFTFTGWNTVANGSGTAYAEGATYGFASDITLYAQWTALPNHTVTFDANGGNGSMTPQVANVPTALTANAFTRTGFTFTGWNTAADGTGTAYADGATYDFAADSTLYAQWSPVVFNFYLPLIFR